MGIKANPGETIRFKKRPWKDQEFLVMKCPQQFIDGVAEHCTWFKDNLGFDMSCPNTDDYVIVTVNTEHAVPGDTIKFIRGGCYAGKQCVVIEHEDSNYGENCNGNAWVVTPGGLIGLLKVEDYRIVKRALAPSIVNDTPADFEKSMKQKRDALLRGWFT